MQLAAVHAEIIATQGIGVPNNPEAEGLSLFEGNLRIVEEGTLDGQWLTTYPVRKDSNGNGGNYAIAHSTTSQTNEEIDINLNSFTRAGYKAQVLAVRVPLFRPVALGVTPSSIKFLSANTHHVELRFLADGTSQLHTDGTLRNTSGVVLPVDADSWPVFEIITRIDAVNGYVRVYKDFNYTTPIFDFTGDTLENSGSPPAEITGVKVHVPYGGGATDDIKVQDISMSFAKGYGTGTPVGGIVNFYDGTGAVKATGSVTVSSGSMTAATITIGDVVLTGTAGARTSGSNDFNMSLVSTTDIATDIAAAINDPANDFAHLCTASPSTNVVTLTAAIFGSARNSITFFETSTPMMSMFTSSFVGGLNGGYIGTGTVTDTAYGGLRVDRIQMKAIEDDLMVDFNGFKSGDPLVGAVTVVESMSFWSAEPSTPDGGLDADSGIPGDGFFAPALLPDGAGAATGLTPIGSPTNYLNVNTSIGPDDEATHNETAVAGTEDLYTTANTAIAGADVNVVKQVINYSWVRKDDTVLNNAELSVRTGTTTGYSHERELPNDYGLVAEAFLEDPDTGVAFTISGVNGAQSGIRFQT